MMIKLSKLIKCAAIALPLILGACKSTKTVENVNVTTTVPTEKQEFLNKVSDNAQYTKFITSKIKFQVQVGAQELSLTGNLKMKRDDVIRLQLMAFGFVEAGRLEFTKEYVLIMDRINKQYLKVSYDQLDFLRNSGLNFYSLQALFWNELFMPGKAKVTESTYKEYETIPDGNDIIISLDQPALSYKWLAGQKDGEIKMVNVMHKSKIRNTQLNWDYRDFKPLGNKKFPTDNVIVFTTGEKEVKLGMKLNYIKSESDWETRTEVSAKYKQVTVDEILRRFMAL